MSVKQMKRQLAIASLSVVMAAVALGSATYAWFVSNTKVDGTTSTVSAQANGMVLQIAPDKDAIHDGSDHQTTAAILGHEISPSSTNDAISWFVPKSWNGTDVSGYQKATIADQLEGGYKLEGDPKTYYAYTMAEYTLYTINQTGEADVYLDNSSSNGPVVVTASEGASKDWFNKIKGSLRVGLLIDNELKVVYAPVLPTGSGNDVSATEGWSCVNPDSLSVTMAPTYAHVYGGNMIDQNGKNWGATGSGDSYVKPTGDAQMLAHVGYNGTNFKVVIWMEGTDSDCQNMSGLDVGEGSPTFDVTVSLVGIVPDSK